MPEVSHIQATHDGTGRSSSTTVVCRREPEEPTTITSRCGQHPERKKVGVCR